MSLALPSSAQAAALRIRLRAHLSERVITIFAASLGVLIVALIAVLMGMA